jgi:Icc-related predicted phosphoesterase
MNINLKYHIFGHIHESYGIAGVYNEKYKTVYRLVNASLCGIPYAPIVNKPIVFDL